MFFAVSSRPNPSVESLKSVYDGDAIDHEPDIFVSHVASLELPIPTNKDEQQHSEHRGGKKAYHHCGAVIFELKRPPRRFVAPAIYKSELTLRFKQAKQQLFTYCQVYFACHESADIVVAFAAVGPFWKWICVTRKDVPAWGAKVGEAEWKAMFARFKKKFGNKRPAFVLGTSRSDAELTKIREECISMVSKEDHTPEEPALE